MFATMTSEEIAVSLEKTKRANRLKWYEEEITKRGKNLAAIFKELRDDPIKPWSDTYPSYEIYCETVWGMTPRRIQQLAAGESVKALLASEAPDLAPILEKMPEGQLRELATTPAEKRQDVLRAATATPSKLTAKKIKAAKARIIDPATGDPEPEEPKCCPTCGRPLAK